MCSRSWLGTPALVLAVVPMAARSHAEAQDSALVLAQRLTPRESAAIILDGELTEAPWMHATVAARFTQREPQEGRSPTERTEVVVLFDDQTRVPSH